MQNRTIALLILLSAFFVGCKQQDYVNETEYYVKYAAEGYREYVIFTNEAEEAITFSHNSSEPFERVIGPVRAGFKAYIQVGIDSNNNTKTQSARIEVRKGDSPFVLKAENSGVRRVITRYTIEKTN
ncbi:MAG TPA: hypothetical protein DCF48_03175 [Rikenellaceae bacterium]|nr:hypothetical protein [Bacteroidales bacterium]HAC40558.1 hypothetical protein [Rikenellaceae bacterium]